MKFKLLHLLGFMTLIGLWFGLLVQAPLVLLGITPIVVFVAATQWDLRQPYMARAIFAGILAMTSHAFSVLAVLGIDAYRRPLMSEPFSATQFHNRYFETLSLTACWSFFVVLATATTIAIWRWLTHAID